MTMTEAELLLIDRCWSCGDIKPCANGLCDRCRQAIRLDLREDDDDARS